MNAQIRNPGFNTQEENNLLVQMDLRVLIGEGERGVPVRGAVRRQPHQPALETRVQNHQTGRHLSI